MDGSSTADPNEILSRQILPVYRRTRARAARRLWRLRAEALAILALGALPLLHYIRNASADDDPDNVKLIMALSTLVIVIAWQVFRRRRRSFNRTFNARVLPLVIQELGLDRYDPTPDHGLICIDKAVRGLALPPYDRDFPEDGLSGTWRAVSWRLQEAKLIQTKGKLGRKIFEDASLIRKAGKRQEVVFHGPVLRIETPDPSPWTVIETKQFGRPQAPAVPSLHLSHWGNTEDNCALAPVRYEGGRPAILGLLGGSRGGPAAAAARLHPDVRASCQGSGCETP